MGYIKTIIKKCFWYSLERFYPNLKLLREDNTNLFLLKNSLINSNIGKSTKLNLPYRIASSEIGDYTYISENSKISLTKIGKFCSIGPNLVCGWGIHPKDGISTAPMFYSSLKQNGTTLSKTDKVIERKQITIGHDVFIGANVIILDGITIGDGAIIGAGAVVSKDIPPFAIAVGSPIKVISYRFDEKTIDKLLSIKWWDFPENKLSHIERLFFNPDQFINDYIKTTKHKIYHLPNDEDNKD